MIAYHPIKSDSGLSDNWGMFIALLSGPTGDLIVDRAWLGTGCGIKGRPQTFHMRLMGRSGSNPKGLLAKITADNPRRQLDRAMIKYFVFRDAKALRMTGGPKKELSQVRGS